MVLDESFRPLLVRKFDLAMLEKEPGAVIGTWPDSRIAYVNPAYLRFAEENGGGEAFVSTWGIGRQLLDAVPEHLKAFYTSVYEQVLSEGKTYEHNYRCPTPERQQRFRMRVYSLGKGEGLLMLHSLFLVGPHEASVDDTQGEQTYRSVDGLIVQCSSCRHVRRADKPEQWDYVFEYVTQAPPQMSYGLCPTCLPDYA